MAEHGSRKKKRNRPSPERIATVRKQHMVLLSVLVLIVFASALGGGFVWTDREDLLQGAYRIDNGSDFAAALTLSREAFRAETLGGGTHDAGTGSWQPLVILSNSLSWALWGECATCWRIEQLLLHLALVIGLYALGRHLLSHRRHGNRISAWAAALYAVHPVTVSSVAWIGGRPELLAALFSVWTLVVFTRLQATTRSRRRHVRRWLVGLAVLSLCALLASEWAMMLPLVALLVAVFESMERDRHPFGGISPRRWKGLGVLIATLLLVLLYRRLVLGGLDFAGEYPSGNLFDNLGTALRHLWFLIQEAVIPGEPILSDAWRITHGWQAGEVAALLGFMVLAIAVVVGLWLRHPAALGMAWFLLWLAPGVGIVPSQHYHNSQILYLATWGIAFALAFTILQFWRPMGRQLVPGSEAIAFVPLVIVAAVITAFSNVRWWEHRALFESEIASDPHYMEGRIELAKEALADGEPLVANNHLIAAFEGARNRDYTGHWSIRDAYMLLGRAKLAQQLYDEAADSFASALENSPDDADAVYWLARTELARGDHIAAEDSLRLALSLRPAFAAAQADLGVALAGQKRFVEALPMLATAIDHGLGNAARHQALAATYIDGRDYRSAARHLEASLALEDDGTERARLAWVYRQLGEHARASEQLAAAEQLSEEPVEYIEWVREQLQQKDGTAQ